METIIITDNKRQSTDYNAQKTLFAQKIDVNQILNSEVYQSHISKIRFWIVKQNIPNSQIFIIDICKNLLNHATNQICLQFSISLINQQKNIKKQQYCLRNKDQSISYQKNQQSRQLNNNRNEYKTQIKINRIFKNTSQINNVNDLAVFLQNQTNIKRQNANSFQKNQNYEEDYHEQDNNDKRKFIVSYVFSNSDMQIGVGIIQEGTKNQLQKIIQFQISEGFNQQFINYENKDKGNKRSPRKPSKLSNQISKQAFHKILLFLFTNNIESQSQSQKQKAFKSSNFQFYKQSKYISAINDWKIKQEQVNMTQKLSKQYILIKHQIQNQKINFKNKLKIFQAIIGQSINVDKLLKEEKQMQSQFDRTQKNLNMNIKPQGNQTNRNSRKSDIKPIKQAINQINNNRSSIPNNISTISNANNSQFRRLKQSFEMIRNIQNTTNQQYKKIQNLKDFIKNVIKQKNQLLFKHAKSLNEIKKQIHTIKQQIQKDKIQLKYKIQNKEKQNNQIFTSSKPSKNVQKILYKKIDIFKKILQNQNKPIKQQQFMNNHHQIKNNIFSKKNKNQTNNYGQYGFHEQQQMIKVNNKQNNEIQKRFTIRKQNNMIHHQNNNQNLRINSTSNSKFNKTMNISNLKYNEYDKINTIDKDLILLKNNVSNLINKAEQQRQIQLQKKRKQQVQNNIIQTNINNQIYKQSLDNEKSKKYQNQKNLLIQLYKYYSNNDKLIKQVKKQLQSYHLIERNNYLNSTQNTKYFNKSQPTQNLQNCTGFSIFNSKTVMNKFSQTISSQFKKQIFCSNTNNLYNKNLLDYQLDLFNFPELFKLMQAQPRASNIISQCSILSDSK